ncbi:MAG: lamin tail domain-containing protein [Bacteroidaceae bacterium]|nr:lamin tail domain-containing protein [Bacteroidaceae bacterium]
MKKAGFIIATIIFAATVTTAPAATRWVDVTSEYFKNPTFSTGDRSDWTFEGEASSFAFIRVGCIEMWQGWMHMHRELAVPNGRYRLSFQSLYRFRRHVWAYQQYVEGTDEHTAFYYANAEEREVPSEYTFAFTEDPGGATYHPDDSHWFCNSMETAGIAFEQGAFKCEIELEVSDGRLNIGIYNDSEQTHTDNWLVVDNIKLEYLTEYNEPAAGDLCINEVVAANVDLQLSPAYNFDSWIELYNTTDKVLNIAGCYLTDNAGHRWQMPEGVGSVPPHGFKQLWLGSNDIRPSQAPFKLDCEGGSIAIESASGTIICSADYPEAISRTAYARTADGADEWSWTATPTPAATNATATFANVRAEAPTVRPDGQIFDGQLRVIARAPQGTVLRYTTDGTTPTLENGQTSANGSINISATTSLRFRCFAEGQLPSEVVTRTYIRKEREHVLPVIAVSTPDDYLYDDMIGVYTRGTNGRTGNGQSSPANWNMNWDRPVNFQYILPETNEMALNQDVDFAISGGWTRSGWIKSFKLKADRVYEGKNTLPYAFFSAKPYIRNKTLQVRYGGNDTGCRIKDAALHEIIQRSGIDLDVMSYQPAVHYINGQYRGLINIREPNNKDFAYANWAITKSDIEIYEQSPDSGAFMMIGRPDTLLYLYDLSATAADAQTYAEICRLVDIDEFINYMAAELYLGSWDWPDNNLKAYRLRDGGRFRITFFDLDAAFGTDGRATDEEGEIYINGNTFRWIDGMQWHRYDYIYDTGESRYGEIKFCTFFLNMLENDDFRRRFIDTFCVMGSVFEPTRAAEICDELGDRVRQTMAWEGASPDGSLNEIREKLKGRAAKFVKQMKEYTRLRLAGAKEQQVTITTEPADAGDIYVNDVRVPYAEYDGALFPPVKLRAEARGGYRFVGWREAENTSRYITGNAEMDLPAQESINLIASFRKMTYADRKRGYPDVRINEVSAANAIYANDNYKRNDWVELYNTTDKDIDLTGLYLSDDKTDPHKYQIASASAEIPTTIPAHSYIIIWCDKAEAKTALHAPFKLDADGGCVSITAADDAWTDILYYPPHNGRQTVARFPDGDDNICVTNVPTINQTNRRSSYLEPVDQLAVGIGDVAGSVSADLSLRRVGNRLVASSSTAVTARLQLFSSDGRCIHLAELRFSGTQATAPLPQLAGGVYIARVTDDQGRTAVAKLRN